MRLVFKKKSGFGFILGLGFGGCGKFGADFGCDKFEACTWGKFRVDSGVTNFEDLGLILHGTNVPFEGVSRASLKLIFRKKKLG
jgi:hypothetical protein